MSASETSDKGAKTSCSNDGSILRDLIKHENELLNHRLTWFNTIQGLLFTALGFAWGKKDARELVFVLCGLGALISISSAFVLWSGARAIDQMSKANKTSNQLTIGRRAGKEKFLYPWYSFPVLFVVAWVAILCINA